MNFLKSVLSSAGGGPPGVTLGDRITSPGERWYTLYNGTRKDAAAAGGDTDVTVFHFDFSSSAGGADRRLRELADNYVLKLRSLRHPGVIRFLSSHETPDAVWAVTERVEPLRQQLTPALGQDKERLLWGLYQIAETMKFVNGDAASVHGNLSLDAVFCDAAGEWKLGGFECLSSMRDDEAGSSSSLLARFGTTIPRSDAPVPPDMQQRGYSGVSDVPIGSVDAYQYGCLFASLFNDSPPSSTAATSPGKIPKECLTQWRRLLLPSAKQRMPIADFVEHGRRQGGWFRSSIITLAEQVPQLPLKPKEEVEQFLSEHMGELTRLPPGYAAHRLLPEVVKALEFGGAGAPALEAIVRLAGSMSEADAERLVQPVLARLWSSQDRALRLLLLERVPVCAPYLTEKHINDRVLASLEASFSDPAPALRERALLASVELLPRLNDRAINGPLLKALAKTAGDREPGIRTNTTICLAKVAPRIDKRTRPKVLSAALSRAAKDPFAPAREAALKAAGATAEEYDPEQLCGRLLPAVVGLLLDPVEEIRIVARTTTETLLARANTLADIHPATAPLIPTSSNGATPSAGRSGASTPAASSEGGWTSWAVSSLSRNLDNLTVSGSSAAASVPVSRSQTSTPADLSRGGTNGLTATTASSLKPSLARTSSSPGLASGNSGRPQSASSVSGSASNGRARAGLKLQKAPSSATARRAALLDEPPAPQPRNNAGTAASRHNTVHETARDGGVGEDEEDDDPWGVDEATERSFKKAPTASAVTPAAAADDEDVDAWDEGW
ncbi:Nuclear aminoacylation-dependent tRNA export pathway component [Savitreella phatthalungensis]